VALGGSSLREPPPPGDAVDRVGTAVALLFLKTRAQPESSLSEFITSTLFPLSGRAGEGVDATAKGTATIGGGEADVRQVREDGGGVCWEATGTRGVRGGTSGTMVSPPPLVDFAFFKNLASASRLEEVITEPATVRVTEQRPIQIKQNGSIYSQIHANNHRGSSDASEFI